MIVGILKDHSNHSLVMCVSVFSQGKGSKGVKMSYMTTIMKSMFLSLTFWMIVAKTQKHLSQCARIQNISYWLDFEYKWRSKIGHQGQKGQISKNVANHLKHVDNRYLIEKTTLNQILSTFSITKVKSFGLRNFHECTPNFLSPWQITMENEENASKSCLNMFLGQNIDSPYVSDHLQQF